MAVLLKTHKFYYLHELVFTKLCLFSLSWKTTYLEKPFNSVVALYRFYSMWVPCKWNMDKNFNWMITILLMLHYWDELSRAYVVFCTLTCCPLLLPAMTHMDKVKLWGKQIKVTPSRHINVQMPKEGQPVSIILSAGSHGKNEIFS